MTSHFCTYCDHPAECHRCASCGESLCEGCCEDGSWRFDEEGERYCCEDCVPGRHDRYGDGCLSDSERTSL